MLAYLDMRSGAADWRPPVVLEANGQACVHVFDGRDGVDQSTIDRWCWRVALRGDGAWVGVLEPGRLRIFRADERGESIHAEQIKDAPEGELVLPALLNDLSAGQGDVARRGFLSQLLKRSADEATSLGLSQGDALSLIGRGLFWRFLVDRGLLSSMRPEQICPDAQTWEQCLDNKKRAIGTFAWLDATFNGGLLPFEDPPSKFPAQVFAQVLGNIAHGATAEGQLRLPSDWRDINFAYLPVGLLSEVYEAFAHSMDEADARSNSIHYTPSHLVEFVVRQAMAQLPVGMRPSVLDPAVGAGVFLVTAFRNLVAHEWRFSGVRPTRKAIRRILNTQLTGFDVDARALRLTELALYLTALELDPKPQPLNELRFDALQDTTLFLFSRELQGSLGVVESRFQARFDLVVGNPPWTAVSDEGRSKKAWVEASRAVVTARLGDGHARVFDLPDANPDLPFLWRAMEWAKPGARIALIMSARWLFSISERGFGARKDVFRALKITGVLNGSALRHTHVWPDVSAPWCVVFAENQAPRDEANEAFHFISPMLDVAKASRQTRIRFDWQDAQAVSLAEVLGTAWCLKTRFRGNRLTARVMDVLHQRGTELGRYLSEELKASFKSGYQVGGKAGAQMDARSFVGLPDTKGAGDLGFVVDVQELPRFARNTLHRTGERLNYRAPLLLSAETISADRLKARVCRASSDVMYHFSYHGLSFAGQSDADDWSRYLQLVLQSGLMVFVALHKDGRYGVEREVIYKQSLELLPIVPLKMLSDPCRAKVTELSDRLTSGLTESLSNEIDEFVFDTFDLSRIERQAVRDALEVGLPSMASRACALAIANGTQRSEFCLTLCESLNAVLSASALVASVLEREDLRLSPWRMLQITISPAGNADSQQPALPWRDFLVCADANGASLVVLRASPSTWIVGLLERYFLWTPTKARLLANDLIAEYSRD